LAEVERLSSHMDIVTPTQAIVTYSWGDFKHDPLKVLAEYFDAFLYAANWGTTRLRWTSCCDSKKPHRMTLQSGSSWICVTWRVTEAVRARFMNS
jgi:hypothetical protein